jgi:hypothetical protein
MITTIIIVKTVTKRIFLRYFSLLYKKWGELILLIFYRSEKKALKKNTSKKSVQLRFLQYTYNASNPNPDLPLAIFLRIPKTLILPCPLP